MITAAPLPVQGPARAPAPTALAVRSGCRRDAAALMTLSRPFVLSGALRERPCSFYVADAADFLVVDAGDGTLDGCVGLKVHEVAPGGDRPAMGVLFNFCVAARSQGRGVGALLLRAALARAQSLSLGALFTATTGSGDLFLRHGFVPSSASQAPAAWAKCLDPRRNSRVLARVL
ncbi:GNAT family N-acetyltransferase [Streptomyces sp. NPDC041068]|uniref:GNAT family N-acetyltransferase n=1 Tax=Streptomyces sp. NPDC041068 TaxID=3155130 RepID=UPI0033E56F94